ncbi:putative Rac prophage; prophage lambda endopeptidase [Xenorhabdus bovienii str. oregonense]|uniref:Putative Rac prophage prophage lambda endopeptidase n=1 Tax=Xenorhabdus bovienii str. oregonense TaxID=1398202 RepID=A0A077P0Z1_XENBV|nr:lysis protein [Xenorhabdus bovienii]CDH08092.1 putative Rac prophage; prophage lambda endopeptidase [Xenorhabdus bovienii str. oregonense]
MKLTLTHYTIIVLIVTTGIASFGSYHYSTEYEKQKKANGRQATEIQQLTDTLNDQNTHIDMLHEQDAKRLKVLANAKSKIDQLSDDLRTNTQRVFVKAECPVRETAAPSGVDSSRPARLEKDAEQDYVRLLGELETLESQFLGLRDYVNTECYKVTK